MINIITGTPGSGKSLRAAYDIIFALEHKKNIIANFDIDMNYFGKKKVGRFTYLTNEQMTVKNLVAYARKYHKKDEHTNGFVENQTTIYIDECTTPEFFNTRTFGQKENKSRRVWVAFFQLHRKFGFNVVLIAQRDKDVDRQIKSFIEHQYACRAVKNYKLFGRFISFFTGGLFVVVDRWYINREVCGKEYFTFNKKKARIYDSMKIFVDLEEMCKQLE